MTSENTGLSRRTLAKGAAWAAPAVVVAAAAPQVAASPVCLTYTFTGDACRWTGANNNWAYHLTLQICNTCPTPITVSFEVASLTNNANKPLTPCDGTGYPIIVDVTIPAKGCSEYIEFGDFSSESSAVNIEAYDSSGNLLFTAKAPVQECVGIDNPCIMA